MVELVEHQGLLANMLVHSLGQPLQLLRYSSNELLRKLSEARLFDQSAKRTHDQINRAFDLVHVAKDQLGLFTKLSQPTQFKQMEPADVSLLIRACCGFAASIARESGNMITFAGVRRIELLPVQRRWLRLALFNIIENACKYSFSSREIMVSAREDDGVVRITVTNFGVGIPVSDLERIFEPYVRSRVPDSKRIRIGTGIGLTIVREVIERLHEGRVFVESTPLKDIEPGDDVDEIADIEHKTVFSIELYRETLERMCSDSGNGRNNE
jgi:signal transduction histidine kinase